MDRPLSEVQYTTPSWHSFELQQLLQLLQQEQGVEIESLLFGTGVTRETLAQPNACVTVAQELEIYIRIANANRDPLLAFRHGRAMGLSQWRLLGQAMSSSATLRDALRLFVRFGKLFSWQVQLSLHREVRAGEPCVVLSLMPTPVDDKTRQFEVESSFAALHTLLTEILVHKVRLSELLFEAPVSAAVADAFAGLGDCQVSGGAVNEFVISEALAERPLPYADPEHLVLLEALCQKHIRQLTQEQDLLGAINKLFNDSEQLPSIEAVAMHFNMSSRTLRRRLGALNSSFQSLLDGHRYGRARELLQDDVMSLEAIAKALDYSDVRSFRMAFKRWSGVAPGEYRRGRLAQSFDSPNGRRHC